MNRRYQSLGASYLGHGWCQFVVWAPLSQRVDVHIIAPVEQVVQMKRDDKGYHYAKVEGVEPGCLYYYRLDGQKERPDPASRFQPQDIHGPSQVIETDFMWEDDSWFGIPFSKHIFYELHVGTFTSEGTFEAIIPHLDDLKELGITAIEIMPVAQFPGDRNWGYDGVYPFAVQSSYGGPAGLKTLVNACHRRGLAVTLDVVYNHLGPEGNYFRDYGPYFTDQYRTPWGFAINFDGPCSDEVRHFFITNALCWIAEFHIDALRLDAVHAIYDRSARPFLEELAEILHRRAKELNRQIYLVVESDLNDSRIVRSRELGGYGLDAQWSDDFHHALHTLLTGEHTGYYEDFGKIEDLVGAYRSGYTYTGQYSLFRKRRHGNSPDQCSADQFIVCSQNHDQVGNRMTGERLSQLASFEDAKLVAGVVLLSPYIPLLFMGEEYGETAPFQYFISHLDAQLVEAVRHGRQEEFSAFDWLGEPPDPQDRETFLQAKLDHKLRRVGYHRVLFEFYKELIYLRKTLSPLANLSKENLEVLGYEKERLLFVRRWLDNEEVVMAFNFSSEEANVALPIPSGFWRKKLDSAEKKWQGNGSPVAEQIRSEGELTLTLEPRAFILLSRLEED